MKSKKRYDDNKLIEKFAKFIIKDFRSASSQNGYVSFFNSENAYFPALKNPSSIVEFFNSNKLEIKKFLGQRKLNNSFYNSSYLTYSYRRNSYTFFDVLKELSYLDSLERLEMLVNMEIKKKGDTKERKTKDYFRRFLLQSLVKSSACSNKLRDFIFHHGSDGTKVATFLAANDKSYFSSKGKRYWGCQLDKATTKRFRKICFHYCSKEKLVKNLKERKIISSDLRYYLLGHKIISEYELNEIENKFSSELEELVELTKTRGFTWDIGRKIQRIVSNKFEEKPFMFLGLVKEIRSKMKEDRSYRYLERIEEDICCRMELIKLDL